MMTKESKATLILLAENLETLSKISTELTVDDILFLIQHMKSTVEGEIPDDLADILLETLKNHEGWFVLRSALAPVPFIKDGKGYIFTDEKLGSNVIEELLRIGYHTELYLQPMYEENALQMLVRNGAEHIVINKGENNVLLDTTNLQSFIDAHIEWSNNEVQLNAVVSDFIVSSDIGDAVVVAESESKLAKAFNAFQLYFVSTPENPTIPKIEDSFAEGYQHNCFYIFTDMNELRARYPRKQLIIHHKTGAEIFEAMNGAEFVLNPISSNILIGIDLIKLCCDESINYNRIIAEVIKYQDENKNIEETVNAIVKYQDIYDEFIAGLMPDGFEYPLESPIAVQNYTAQVLQRIVAQNHIEAYKILSDMRTYPEAVEELLTASRT